MNAQDLTYLLLKFSVPLETWGIGFAKTLSHLQKELQAGEAKLVERPVGEAVRLIWRTRSAGVEVRFRDLILREDRQVFMDGRERRRTWVSESSVMEKLMNGEDYPLGAQRALWEKLHVPVSPFSLWMSGGRERHVGPIESMSYPGLLSECDMVVYDFYIPECHFDPEGYVEEQADKKTCFAWHRLVK